MEDLLTFVTGTNTHWVAINTSAVYVARDPRKSTIWTSTCMQHTAKGCSVNIAPGCIPEILSPSTGRDARSRWKSQPSKTVICSVHVHKYAIQDLEHISDEFGLQPFLIRFDTYKFNHNCSFCPCFQHLSPQTTRSSRVNMEDHFTFVTVTNTSWVAEETQGRRCISSAGIVAALEWQKLAVNPHHWRLCTLTPAYRAYPKYDANEGRSCVEECVRFRMPFQRGRRSLGGDSTLTRRGWGRATTRSPSPAEAAGSSTYATVTGTDRIKSGGTPDTSSARRGAARRRRDLTATPTFWRPGAIIRAAGVEVTKFCMRRTCQIIFLIMWAVWKYLAWKVMSFLK